MRLPALDELEDLVSSSESSEEEEIEEEEVPVITENYHHSSASSSLPPSRSITPVPNSAVSAANGVPPCHMAFPTMLSVSHPHTEDESSSELLSPRQSREYCTIQTPGFYVGASQQACHPAPALNHSMTPYDHSAGYFSDPSIHFSMKEFVFSVFVWETPKSF
jgi:hypothetical protein